MIHQVQSCRICGNRSLEQVLDLGDQALTGVFPASRDQAVTRGPLRLLKCVGDDSACGLLQLEHTYDLEEMYGGGYGYRSGLNVSMVRHLQGKVAAILNRISLTDDPLIIDIGSNDSTTLQAYPASGCTLVGVDPTGAKFRSFYPPHVQLIPEFFTAQAVRQRFGARKARVITSFSMFYDLERPMQFMQEVRELLDPQGIWVLEQSYMPTMLARNSYDTVCHEHLEYYGLAQLDWMARRTGLKVLDVEFNDINGGSFSVIMGHRDSRREPADSVAETLRRETQLALTTRRPYVEFAQRVAASREKLNEFLNGALQTGKRVVGLGASTKGNVILQYCGITPRQLSQIGEVNPDKFGHFTPGSLIPICEEAQLLATEPDYILVLPWHFRAFFATKAKPARSRYVFPLPTIEVS